MLQTGIVAFDKVAHLLRYHNKGSDSGMLFYNQVESQNDLLFGVAICSKTYNTANYKATPFLSVDLDLKLNKLGYTSGEELVTSFIDTISKLWLKPHWYILTGNGGHVFWNLENNFSNQIHHIKSIYALMSKKYVFQDYGTDPASYRVIKFSRVPKSWSIKNQCTVEGFELKQGYYSINEVLNTLMTLESVPNLAYEKKETLKQFSLEGIEITPEFITAMVDTHGRNIALFNILLHYKKSGYTKAKLKKELKTIYALMNELKLEPFTLSEASTVLNSVLKTNITLYPSKRYDLTLLLNNLNEIIFINSKTNKRFDIDGQATVKKILTYLLENKFANGYLEFNVALTTLSEVTGLTKQTISYYLSRLELYFIKVDNTFIIGKRGKGYKFTDTFIERLTA